MHAVVRETAYDPSNPFYECREFQEFQAVHENQPGYVGTVIVETGPGHFFTMTLWQSEQDMNLAREVVGPVAARLLNPMMTTPPKLLGTGPVVVKDW